MNDEAVYAFNGAHEFLIADNYIEAGPAYGVRVATGADARIRGNRIIGQGSSVAINSESPNAILSENRISGGASGIIASGSHTTTIGNVVSGMSGYAITHQGGSVVSGAIAGNASIGNTGELRVRYGAAGIAITGNRFGSGTFDIVKTDHTISGNVGLAP
jgi:hypothetical protein